MEQVSIFKFYKFGELVNELLDIYEDSTNLDIYNKLANFYDFVEELKLDTTKSALNLAKLDIYYRTLKKVTQSKAKCDEVIDDDLFNNINDAVNSIKITLDAEIFNKNAYVLTPKRYSNTLLTKDIFQLFSNPKEFQLYIPEAIKFHFVECGYCMAFDRGTAASFHVLRGTEEFIRFFKSCNDDKDLEHVNGVNFFELINAVDEIFKSNGFKKKDELINTLHMIRKNYRNEAQHSDRIFTVNESFDLLNLCVSAINIMLEHLDFSDYNQD